MSTNSYDPSYAGGPAVREGDRRQSGANIHPRISWPALFAGVVIILAVQILLSVLGAAIGLSTVHVNNGQTPDASTLGIGAGIWWVVSSCVALAVGGYLAAWLAGIETRFDGMLHGLAAWSISTLLMVMLVTSAIGGIIGGGFSALRSVTSSASSTLGEAAKPLASAAGVSPDMLNQQARSLLQGGSNNADPATMSPQDAEREIATNLPVYAAGGPQAAGAKDRIIAIMAAQMKISPEQATQQFNQAEAKVRQTRDQAVQTAKDAADVAATQASRTSYIAFGVLLLGLISAAIGGSLAAQRRHNYGRPVTGWNGRTPAGVR